MKSEIVPYEPIHAYTILDRNVREQEIWLSKYPDWGRWAEGWEKGGPAYSLIVDGEIVGSAGIVLLDWNRGEAWALLSSLFYRYKKTAYSAIVKMLDQIIQEKKLRRVQALIKPDFEEAKRMAEHLGFKCEGLLAAFGPNGEDLLMYGRRC